MTNRVAEGQFLGARQTQEDAVRVSGERARDSEGDLLLILADGMGGHAGGEIASTLAVDSFAHHFNDVSTNLRPRGRLSEALEAANGAIAKRVEDAPDLRGMGCTLIGTLIAGGRLVWVSVGDSILFLLRDGRLRRLNADHSLFGELMEHVDRGEMTRAEAEAHPRRNALRAALTGDEIALIDLDAIEVDPGDVVILASDGIETLQPSEIERLAQDARRDGPEAIRTALLEAVEARHRPHQDNTSVVVMAIDRAATSAVGWREPPAFGSLLRSFNSQVAAGLALAMVLGFTTFMLVSNGQTEDAPVADVSSADAEAESRSAGGGSTEIDEPAGAAASGDTAEEIGTPNDGDEPNDTSAVPAEEEPGSETSEPEGATGAAESSNSAPDQAVPAPGEGEDRNSEVAPESNGASQDESGSAAADTPSDTDPDGGQ